jgi:hypothetical protein
MNIIYPVFLLVFHTMLVAVRLGYLRYTWVSQGKVNPAFYVAYQGEEPETLRVCARHLINLLETPVLFYVASVIALTTAQAGPVLIGLAWAYVLTRLVHSAVHLGPNLVLRRFQVFATSMVLLMAYWGVLFAALVSR